MSQPKSIEDGFFRQVVEDKEVKYNRENSIIRWNSMTMSDLINGTNEKLFEIIKCYIFRCFKVQYDKYVPHMQKDFTLQCKQCLKFHISEFQSISEQPKNV